MSEFPWLRHYDDGVPYSLSYPDEPLHQFLHRAAERFPERACTIFHDRMITYRQMEQLTNQLAVALQGLGLQQGDRVGLLLPNIPQFVLAFYAVLKAGGVVVACNPQYRAHELVFQVKNAGIRFMIGLDSLHPLMDEVRREVAIEQLILTRVEDAFGLAFLDEARPLDKGHDGDGLWLLPLIASVSNASVPSGQVTAQDVAIFQYSGGTTGTPKAAMGLHRNLVANTIQFRHWLIGLEDGKETVLAAIPLFHVYGMVIAMSVGISCAASLVLVPNPRNLDDLLQNIQRYRTTLFPGVPNLYQSINHHPDVAAGKYDLRSIKACISGSAPLLAVVKDTFEALTGGKLMEGYGLSEAPTATHCNPMFSRNKPGSIGLPLPDVEARIVDPEDGERILAPGETGELIIRGPQVMAGYFGLPEEDQIALRGGWLYTGDIARMDEDGYFYLVDRKKDMIKIGGFQVLPREVEEVLAMHPAVKEVGVAGVPHPERVEVVKAWVVLKPGQILSMEEIRKWCKLYLVQYKIPVDVEFVDNLPRTSVGKLLRRELVLAHLEKQKNG